MKQIELSKQGKHKRKYFALVDDEDFEYLNNFNWNILKVVSEKSELFYAQKNICIGGLNRQMLMHTLIMKTKKGMEIDHINHNGLDNRKINLREVTHSTNMQNARKSILKTSKYKGVSKDMYYKNNIKYEYWRALIYIINPVTLKRRKISIGLCPYTQEGEIMAAELYNNAAIKYYGDKCYLNDLSNHPTPKHI